MKTDKGRSTAYGVYIIESLAEEDLKDGERLDEILKRTEILSVHRKCQTREEFIELIGKFYESNYRYLYISCHARLDGLLIGDEIIDNHELKDIFDGCIKGRRIFFSACEAGNRYMASLVISCCKGQSVIGPPSKVKFARVALFWATFFYIIYEVDGEKMDQKGLRQALKKCVELFSVPINYYHKSKKSGLTLHKFRKGKSTERKDVKVAKHLDRVIIL